jgi:uncharacterized protein YeaO (DUF488 family)
MSFQIKRVYDSPSPSDGKRILVDRLWPRGLKKSDAHLDLWMKDVAPSPPLRQWFHHDPERFPEFSQRYTRELKTNPAVNELRELGKNKRVTLLYAAHDPKVNHALVLQSALGKAKAPTASRRSVTPTRKPGPRERHATR